MNYNDQRTSTVDESGAPLLDSLGDLVDRLRGNRDQEEFTREVERYISSAAADHLRRPTPPERLHAAILFSDLRNFTATSFQADLEEVFSGLNTLLSHQTQIIRSWSGYVDRFAGDGIMAVFTGQDASLRACKAAQDLVRWATDCEAVPLWASPPIAVGVHVGTVLRGELGSEQRSEYTVLGPAVNVASRLCGHACAHEVVVSDQVVDRVAGDLPFGPRRGARLKGVPSDMSVYTLSTR